jgi:hypothetical protein
VEDGSEDAEAPPEVQGPLVGVVLLMVPAAGPHFQMTADPAMIVRARYRNKTMHGSLNGGFSQTPSVTPDSITWTRE